MGVVYYAAARFLRFLDDKYGDMEADFGPELLDEEVSETTDPPNDAA